MQISYQILTIDDVYDVYDYEQWWNTLIRELRLSKLITHVPMRFTTHVDFKNGGLHGTHTQDVKHTLFLWNYEVGSAGWGDDGDDVDFEHPDSDGSFDFF